jgi:phage gp16-like protein
MSTTTARQPTKRAPSATPSSDARSRLIVLLHVARRELRLDEASYRAILSAKTGKDSAADLSLPQLQAVLDYLKTTGFKVKSSKPAAARHNAPAQTLASDPESRKARAMWLTLHAIGEVRDPSEAALQAYARRQCKVDRLEWVKDPFPLIESLKSWCLRSLPAVVEPYLQRPVEEWAGHMRPTWRANWHQAVLRLKTGRGYGRVQLLDEWVDLWHLIQSTKETGK